MKKFVGSSDVAQLWDNKTTKLSTSKGEFYGI